MSNEKSKEPQSLEELIEAERKRHKQAIARLRRREAKREAAIKAEVVRLLEEEQHENFKRLHSRAVAAVDESEAEASKNRSDAAKRGRSGGASVEDPLNAAIRDLQG